MSFINQFELFDPLTGAVNDYPLPYLPEIAVRARSILISKTPWQLVGAAKRIDREIELYFADLKDSAIYDLKSKLEAEGAPIDTYFEWDGGTGANGRWIFKEEMVEDLEIPTSSSCSEVDALKAIIENRDFCFFLPEGAPLPEPEHYPEGKTHELFAVLSLWLLVDAIEWSKTGGKYSMSIAAGFAVKSMDAVCYAEQLREIEWNASYLRKKSGAELTDALSRQYSDYEKSRMQAKSERATELNKLRHAATTHAKERVTAEWAKNPSQFSSAEKAGNHYANWLKLQGVIKSIEPRTVTGWIRAYAKEIGVRFR